MSYSSIATYGIGQQIHNSIDAEEIETLLTNTPYKLGSHGDSRVGEYEYIIFLKAYHQGEDHYLGDHPIDALNHSASSKEDFQAFRDFKTFLETHRKKLRFDKVNLRLYCTIETY